MYFKEGPILERAEPEEIAAFYNKVFAREIRVFCPWWFAAVERASDIRDIDNEPGKLNSCALASAAVAHSRNSTLMTAYHYRNSTILFHSGAKHDDLVRLNRLGICMPPISFRRLQRKMGESLEA